MGKRRRRTGSVREPVHHSAPAGRVRTDRRTDGPPPLLGNEREREAQLRQLEGVPVRTLARIAFTRAGLTELVQALAGNREIYDQIRQARDEEMGGGI